MQWKFRDGGRTLSQETRCVVICLAAVHKQVPLEGTAHSLPRSLSLQAELQMS